MAVTLTRARLRNQYPRLLDRLTDAEVDEYLSQATDQVAAWVVEASGGLVTFTQFYQNKCGALEVAILASRDRMAGQADAEEEDATATPAGGSTALRHKLSTRGLEKMYQTLLNERRGLLAKLGVADEAGLTALPVVANSCVRAEDTTGADADPGIDWQGRNDTPEYFSR